MMRPTKPIVERIGYNDLIELIWEARDVVYCSPNVHPEIAEALVRVGSKEGASIRVLLDPSEWAFRNGFGEHQAVDQLIQAGIEVREAPGIQIGFIAADGVAYFLFPQSRALVEEGAGDNAVAMDALTLERLLLHYFPPTNEVERERASARLRDASTDRDDLERAAERALDDATERDGAPSLDHVKYAETKERLQANKPNPPDLRRKINVYVNKLQFVELEFEGSGFHNARIELPEDALPISNPELRAALETRMKVFPDRGQLEEREEFASYFELKDEVKRIRDEYFVHAPSRKKNVLRIERKAELMAELESLEDYIATTAKGMVGHLKNEILRRRKLLREQIETILRASPHPEDVGLQGELFDEAVTARAHAAVNEAKFPDPKALVETLSITYRFFDPTWDDFSDADFVRELHERGAILDADASELRSLKDAYETQRTEAL